MCSGAILPKMLLFAIPLMCSSILLLLFNAADIIVVGRYAGDNSLAAVGSNTSLIGLLTNLFIGLSIGTNVLASRYYGAKAEDDLAKTVHTSIVLGIASGILLSVIGIVGARRILIWMQTPEEVLGLATLYLVIYFSRHDRDDGILFRQRDPAGRRRYEAPALFSRCSRHHQRGAESLFRYQPKA